jgi:large subunit ribosomal protein L9
MKVVFLEDVDGVARGGEVKEVKNGFARNYLIPQNLAAPATHNNLQRIGKLSNQASITRVQQLKDMKELAESLKGTQVNIEMRAGVNNRLYGSVTGTMIADAVMEETGREIERRLVQLDSPIREVGTFEVPIRLHSEILTLIKVIVYATGSDPTEVITEVSNEEVADIDQAVVDSSKSPANIGNGTSAVEEIPEEGKEVVSDQSYDQREPEEDRERSS